MRTYILQIHNDSGNERDELYIFREFENLCLEFKNKYGYFGGMADSTNILEHPLLDDETGEVRGKFEVVNADGSITEGIVYDYDILDDDE